MTERYERLGHAQAVVIDDDCLILDTSNGVVTRTNEVGGFVWGCLEEKLSLAELARAVEQKYDVSNHAVMQDIVPFLSQLVQIGLVRNSNA